MTAPLKAIPLVDVRDGGPPQHARQSAERARALRDACIAFFPRAARPFVPALDWLSYRSLTRSRSPYVAEIAQIAASLGFSGVWLLNASYQWGCTARAGEQGGAPWLARALDWPFRGLGHHTELAHMRGRCGDFVSVTWPGYVGVLTAMAPGRFRRRAQPGADVAADAASLASSFRLRRERAARFGGRQPDAAGSASAPGF